MNPNFNYHRKFLIIHLIRFFGKFMIYNRFNGHVYIELHIRNYWRDQRPFFPMFPILNPRYYNLQYYFLILFSFLKVNCFRFDFINRS